MTSLEQYNNELYHYGVKGMKWGVRRYQNDDGTFNNDGQKLYRRMSGNERIANASVGDRNKYRKQVISKYDRFKTVEQKQADSNVQKAWNEYQKYVEDYSKSHSDTQTKYEHDFDHTKKGRRLIANYISADETRQKAYAGVQWLAKYAKDLDKAALKDYRQSSRNR